MGKARRLFLPTIIVGTLQACGLGGGGGGSSVPPPAAPTGIGVSAPSSGRIDVTWTDASGDEQGFRIECSTDGATFTEVGTAPADTMLFTHRGLAPDTQYWYRVRSYNAGGTSAYDGPASTTTLPVAWSALPTGGPQRTEHAAVFDPLGSRMIVFGGFDGSSATGTNDVWELTLGATPAWNLLTTTGAGPPAIRDNHTAVYEPAGNRMIVFGGLDRNAFVLENDTWELDLSSLTWSELLPGTPPPARIGHTAVYDAANQRMIVYGGNDGGGPLSDVWQLDLSGAPAWSPLTTSGAPLREEHLAVYDGTNQRMLVLGGVDVLGAPQDELWELTLPTVGTPTWTRLSAGTPPSARLGPAGIVDVIDERFVVFSGDDGILPMNTETWFLNLVSPPQWAEAFPAGGPAVGLWGHSAVYDSVGHRMVIFGGNDLMGTIQSEVWGLDF